MPAKPFSTRRKLRPASAGLLILGLAAAAGIFIATAASVAGSSTATGTLHGFSTRLDGNQRELAEVERLGGKVSVMTVEFHQWFLSLWESRCLLCTLP